MNLLGAMCKEKMILELAKNYRVIVPDHIDFGKNATPQDRLYTLESHVENLTRLIEDLNLKNITFIVQDWGSYCRSLCFKMF